MKDKLIGERSAEEKLFALKQKFLLDMLDGKSTHDLFEEYIAPFQAKEDSLPEATEKLNNKNISDVEFYTKNLLACAHNLVGVIENKQWERLDKKTWALKDAYTKLKIHSSIEAKEERPPESDLEYCHKRMAEAYNEIRRLEKENSQLKEDNKAFVEWISVDERKPRVPGTVLVWHKARKTVLKATLYNEGYKSRKYNWVTYDIDGSNRIEFDEITHWMPLPSPPVKNKT